MKKKAQKKIRAWAVLISHNQVETGGNFSPIGNGAQFQYPVFHSRREARSYVEEDTNTRGAIIPCTITLRTRI